MRVYLASPFFNTKETLCMEQVLRVLRNSGYDVFAPYEFKVPDAWNLPNDEWGKIIFKEDVKEIEKADVVVAINHGLRSDSGTAFEIGYSYSLGKKVFVVYFENNIDSLMINNAICGAINFKDFLNNEKIDLKDYEGIKSENEQK